MYSVILYHTSGCHLCELAEAVLEEVQSQLPGLTWTLIDIATDEVLIERYGWRIPVIQVQAGSSLDLGWPFNVEDVARFVKGQLIEYP